MEAIMIGFGTVGQGAAELLVRHRDLYAQRAGEPIELVGVLVRDASKPREVALPEGCTLTEDEDELFAMIGADRAGEPGVLIEAAGGVDAQFDRHVRAIDAGLDIVTANKSLIAKRGGELFTRAHTARRRIRIEATVAGGVPILETITSCLSANRVRALAGITNGTCHFIIRSMEQGMDYAQALAKAQEMGFAEADPTLDVGGRDSQEKLCIMAALAFGVAVDVDSIPSAGVTGLTPSDLEAARDDGEAVRLLGVGALAQENASGDTGALRLYNGPVRVPSDSPLAACPADEMAVQVWADAAPRMLSAGAGAGRFPTASAVVADVLKVAKLRDHRPERINDWPIGGEAAAVLPIEPGGLPRLAELITSP